MDAHALRQIAEALRPLKLRTYELMHVDTGMQVLDVGCGPGIDTISLSNEIGTTGRGVDVDEDLLAHAEAYAREMGVAANVVHQRDNVSALPFPAETFDACRAERLSRCCLQRWIRRSRLQRCSG